MLDSPAISDAFQAAKSDAIQATEALIVKWPIPPLSTHFQALLEWATSAAPPVVGLLTARALLTLTGTDPSSSDAKVAYKLGWMNRRIIYLLLRMIF
jgi:hypothetical protein